MLQVNSSSENGLNYKYPLLAAFIRPILLILLNKAIRNNWRRFIYVIIDSFQMVLFIIFYIFFFAALGLRIFRGTLEGVESFDTLGDAAFNLLILLTTANFPDFMLPAYEASRINCLFFIAFLIVGLFLLMNMLLAIFYSNYKKRYDNTLETFNEERSNYLEEKFNEYDVGAKGYLDKDDTYKMMLEVYNLDDSKSSEFEITPELFEKMFRSLDLNLSGHITREEFQRIFEVYELYKYSTSKGSFVNAE